MQVSEALCGAAHAPALPIPTSTCPCVAMCLTKGNWMLLWKTKSTSGVKEALLNAPSGSAQSWEASRVAPWNT